MVGLVRIAAMRGDLAPDGFAAAAKVQILFRLRGTHLIQRKPCQFRQHGSHGCVTQLLGIAACTGIAPVSSAAIFVTASIT